MCLCRRGSLWVLEGSGVRLYRSWLCVSAGEHICLCNRFLVCALSLAVCDSQCSQRADSCAPAISLSVGSEYLGLSMGSPCEDVGSSVC